MSKYTTINKLPYIISDISNFLLFRIVLKMNAAFSEPHKVIDSLFQNFVNVNPKYKPSIELEPLLQGRLWKAHLNFAWPMPFRVTTRSTDRDHATHYAYLEACDMFRVSIIESL